MAKKKKKKKNKNYCGLEMFTEVDTSKKKLHKKFNKAVKEIESMQLTLMEADKLQNKKNRKQINKKEQEFYTDMESLRCRRKMAKNWEETGFLDRMLELVPLIKSIAKILAVLIITFLSIDGIRAAINPNTLSKIGTVFDIVMAV